MKYQGMIQRGIGTACYECPDRHPACHDTCPKYQQALAEWMEFKRNAKHNKQMHQLYDKYRVEAYIKGKRRKGDAK